MATARVDSKKRVVLPNGRPGDIYDVQPEEDGRVVLVRLETPKPAARMSRKACLEAMKKAPLTPRMSWEELRRTTREL